MTSPSPATAPSDNPDCLSYLLLAGAAAWLLVVCVSVQFVGWFIDQYRLIQGEPVLGGGWLPIALVQAVLLLPPVLLLLFFTRAPRLRAVYQSWAAAIAAATVLGAARLFFLTQTQA